MRFFADAARLDRAGQLLYRRVGSQVRELVLAFAGRAIFPQTPISGSRHFCRARSHPAAVDGRVRPLLGQSHIVDDQPGIMAPSRLKPASRLPAQFWS